MYNIYYGLLPTAFLKFFRINNDIHDHQTRQSSKLHVVSHRTTCRANSIQIYEVKLWNCLSEDITNAPSISIFKSKCKKNLICS